MKVLIVENTHGDEISGLRFPSFVDVIIGNPRAKESGVRFIESDLNRSFNGRIGTMEEKRAVYLREQILPKYDFVLDIHSTTSGGTDAVITAHDSAREREIAHYLNATNYVYLPDMQHSLIYHAKDGLALELAGVNEKELYQKAIDNFMAHLLGGSQTYSRTEYTAWKSLGAEKKLKGYTTDLKNYESVSKGQVIASKGKETLLASEDFTTFLWNEKSYTDIFGFKLVKM